MATKTKKPVRPAILRAVTQTTPWTTEERLERIEMLGQKVNGYVQFMCEVGNQKSTSAEARERAVLAFYEQMVVMERRLGLIQDEFKLE